MMVLSNISTATLPLRAFFTTQDECDEYITDYLHNLQNGYKQHAAECMSTINRLHPVVSPSKAKGTTTPNPKTPSPKTLKRNHSRISLVADEKISPRAKEVKAGKNAKLLKAMRDVEKTLGGLEMEERWEVNGVF
jgi:hypothetical protein